MGLMLPSAPYSRAPHDSGRTTYLDVGDGDGDGLGVGVAGPCDADGATAPVAEPHATHARATAERVRARTTVIPCSL
jgi:hypothetical protein